MEPSAEEVAADVRAYREADSAWAGLDGALRLAVAGGEDVAARGRVTYRVGVRRRGVAGRAECARAAGNGHPARQRAFTFAAGPGVEAVARGARVDTLVLRSDAESAPDEIAVGPLRLELIRRGDDFALRVRPIRDSPLRREFAGVPAYEPERRWWINARFSSHGSRRRPWAWKTTTVARRRTSRPGMRSSRSTA